MASVFLISTLRKKTGRTVALERSLCYVFQRCRIQVSDWLEYLGFAGWGALDILISMCHTGGAPVLLCIQSAVSALAENINKKKTRT